MTQTLFDLSGRTALVTGSSRGLGRAIAEGMAKAGARLIVNGTDPARVETAVAEFRSAGHLAEGVAFDVTDETAVVRAFVSISVRWEASSLARRSALYRSQRRHQDADSLDGGRMGSERNPSQCDRARLYADRHEPGACQQCRF